MRASARPRIVRTATGLPMVHAPRWVAVRRALLGAHDPVGACAVLAAAALLSFMLLRVALAWRAGLL